MTTISVAEILAELEAASKQADAPDGYLTIAEIERATGWGEKKVRAALRDAKALGRLMVTTARRATLRGTLHPVPVYRVTASKRKR